MRGFLKILCAVSLLMNVALAGVIGGYAYKRWSAQPAEAIRAELSPEVRHLVGQTFQHTFREIKPLGDEARAARENLVGILSADEFDGDAYDLVVARLMDVRGEVQGLKIQATKDLAMSLPAIERQKMAARMAKMAGGGRGAKFGPYRRDIRR